MLEGINDAWNSLWRLFSMNTFNGEQNVFNNFSKALKVLRSGIVYATSEVCRQVFEGGAEMVKSLRDEFTRLFTSNPSSSDASAATNTLKTNSGRSGFTSNPGDIAKGFAGSKSAKNSSKRNSKGSNSQNDLNDQMRKHRYMQQMQSQNNKKSSRSNEY
jgi:hypothetical protein